MCVCVGGGGGGAATEAKVDHDIEILKKRARGCSADPLRKKKTSQHRLG